MALQKFHKTYYTQKAKKYGVPETHPLIQRIKRGDESAAHELDNFFEKTYQSKQPYNAYTNQDIGANKYGIEAVKGFAEPEGSFWWGKPGWKEQIPLNTPEQQQYMNNALNFSSERMPQMYDEWGKLANRGVLGELLGDETEQGIQGLLGGLGQYLPQLLGAGAGTALTGGGIGDVLQSLIGSIASQRLIGNNNQGSMGQGNMQQQQPTGNMPSNNGNYYNQGMNALSDLWNNRGQYRR